MSATLPTHHLLGGLLLGAPYLEGAACAGRAPLWDGCLDAPETRQARRERHQQALRVCRGCPVRRACREHRRAHPTLGDGVWGGHLFEATPTRACRCCAREIPADPNRRYCSPHCRQLAATQRQPPRPARAQLSGLRHCQHCGVELTGEQRRKNMRNCSPRCRHAHAVSAARARAKDHAA